MCPLITRPPARPGVLPLKVVCAIILRDLETLLQRYLRKMRKSVARMYWDEDYDDYEEDDDLPRADVVA